MTMRPSYSKPTRSNLSIGFADTGAPASSAVTSTAVSDTMLKTRAPGFI